MIDDGTPVDPDAETGVAPTEVNTPQPEPRGWAVPVALAIVSVAGLSVITFATVTVMRSHGAATSPAVHPVNTVTETATEPPVTETSTEPPTTITEPPVTATVTEPQPYTPLPMLVPKSAPQDYDQEFLARVRSIPGWRVWDTSRALWWAHHACSLLDSGLSLPAAEARLVSESGTSTYDAHVVAANAELVYPHCGPVGDA